MGLRRDLSTSAGRLVFLAYLGLVVSAGWFQPRYDWDVLGYVGCALELTESDSATIHARAYADVRASVPAAVYADLVGRNPYRRDVAAEPQHFRQQLPFYRARVLYVGLIFALGTLGLSLTQAAVLVSTASAVLLGLLVFRWVARYVGGVGGGLASALILVAAGLLDAARATTPDALSAALLVLALYLWLERRCARAALVVAGLSLLVRSDALVPVLAVLVVARRQGVGPFALTARRGVLTGAVLGGVCLAATLLLRAHGWWTVFHHSFLGYVANPVDYRPAFALVDYAAVLVEALPALHSAGTALLAIYLGLAWIAWRRSREARPLFPLVVAVAASALVRFAIFPMLLERFFVAHLVAAGVLALMALAEVLGSTAIEEKETA